MIFEDKDSAIYYCPFQTDRLDSFCEGSKCAAWRWFYDNSESNNRKDNSGYCGLAGKPEFE
jgi:hypothetical protein